MDAPAGEWRQGRLTALVRDGALRRIAFAGNEVLRGISYPVRDEDWGTFATETLAEIVGEGRYRRDFVEPSEAFRGTFEVVAADETALVASLHLVFARAARVNRAGLAVLHPIRGIAGSALRIRHPDGRSEETTFPAAISPGQPAFDIAGLDYRAGPVGVAVAFGGEVFEMEDQRNWSDASFKTYCRPLGWPRPYAVAAGDEVRQSITLTLTPDRSAGPTAAAASRAVRVTVPEVLLVHEAGLSTVAALDRFPGLPVLARIGRETPGDELVALARRERVALEIVCDDAGDLVAQVARVAEAGLTPKRATALPRSYLASHQPEGPWPEGMTPGDAQSILRRAMPGVPAGGGSLTNFAECNRCRPTAGSDFVTFGNTAIVHAADDQSVCETLEALPDIFASGRALVPGRPLHLGLVSIGMRSNPYGTALAPNPDRVRMPMAMDDPRQETDFAAAYAVAVLVLAARARASSVALAMADGPLGASGRPIGRVIVQAALLAGAEADAHARDGVFALVAGPAGLAANMSDVPRPHPLAGRPLLAAYGFDVWGDGP